MKKPMRVAFVVHDFPMLSETFILNQATGLIERGHEVDIYTDRIHPSAHAHPDVQTYGLTERTYQLPKVPRSLLLRMLIGCWLLLRYGYRNPLLFLRSLNVFRYGMSVLGFRWVYYAVVLLDKGPYDIVHSQFGTQGFVGMCLTRLMAPQAKHVTTFRGYDISTYVQEHGADSYAELFHAGDLFFANCEFFRQRAIQLGCDPDKIFVHQSGLDLRKFPFVVRSRPSERGVHLTTTGRLVEKKGIEYAIRAVAQLLLTYPDLRYRIIGDGSLRETFQQLIETLQIGHAVQLLGWKNEQEIADILHDTDIFVAPSVTARDGNQDAPVNVLKEAMAMGLPVVSTWHGGIPELVKDGVNGFLVPERNVQALVDRLQALIQCPELAKEMGRAGRHTVETEYNLCLLNDRLVERYQQLHFPAQNTLSESTGEFYIKHTGEKMGEQLGEQILSSTDVNTTPLPEGAMESSTKPINSSSEFQGEQPDVTIVVVPRERFSFTERSLESIYEHTTLPFELVYVDGNSPKPIQHYLQEQAQARGFQLIRKNYYLYPNQARNIGLAAVKTKYLVFVDNDVIVSPGWLEALVHCAEETNAAVVGPLMCQYEPIHEEVHFAGGESHVWVDKTGRRRLREKMYEQGRKVTQLRDRLVRHETELAEFHCVLVRTRIFDQLGQLDENMLNTKEHLDFCMSVRQAGESVYFEPACLVTYVPGPPMNWGDLHYYMLRWSNQWTVDSLTHLRQKWNLAEDGYFKSKYKKLGWRRNMTIIEPFVRRLTLGRGNSLMVRALAKFEPKLNQYLTRRHARLQQRVTGVSAQALVRSPELSPESLPESSPEPGAQPELSKTT
ncbi:glycosyltransferase [Leptolyngbya sp. AN02str]|uniref:glycosyltransferase n=1 Tax=Leptolyngbya sp. AN02str TaxID=3423363 RepID=UPI003D31C839